MRFGFIDGQRNKIRGQLYAATDSAQDAATDLFRGAQYRSNQGPSARRGIGVARLRVRAHDHSFSHSVLLDHGVS